jgi:hypothetical protein
MQAEFTHLSDRDLTQAADGEITSRRKAQVDAHLEACWSCRERMQSLQNTIADFVRARNEELNPQLPAAGPRALLQARLAEAAATPSLRHSFSAPALVRFAIAGAGFLAVLAVILMTFESRVSAEGPKPRLGLTPGEARPITLQEVCRYSKAEVISRDISEETRQKVFNAYGIKSPRSGQFEVDYLITPDLGGTESLRNLWPQPYSARWNARTKDQLEQRLHELVCGGKLDLATAQHDIAVDWIGAYRKYRPEGGYLTR